MLKKNLLGFLSVFTITLIVVNQSQAAEKSLYLQMPPVQVTNYLAKGDRPAIVRPYL